MLFWFNIQHRSVPVGRPLCPANISIILLIELGEMFKSSVGEIGWALILRCSSSVDACTARGGCLHGSWWMLARLVVDACTARGGCKHRPWWMQAPFVVNACTARTAFLTTHFVRLTTYFVCLTTYLASLKCLFMPAG